MTGDIVQRTEAALDGITPGPWKIDPHDESNLDIVVSTADDRIGGWIEVAKSIGRDAEFIAGAPELVRELLAEVERQRVNNDDFKEALRLMTLQAMEAHTRSPDYFAELQLAHVVEQRDALRAVEQRDALRAKVDTLTALLGEAWDDGNATGLDGWVGPGRGADDIDAEATRARERFLRRGIGDES